MSLTEREKENAIECWHEIAKRGKGMNPEMFADLFLSRIRDEHESIFDEVLELFGKYWDIAYEEGKTGTSWAIEANDILHRLRRLSPLFTIPPAAPDCSELVEALKGLILLLNGDDKTMGMLDAVDGYYQFSRFSIPFMDKANKALANHAKRMKGEE